MLTLREWHVIYFLTRESVSRYRRPLRSIIFYLFVSKINKGDLPLMYSCVF